MRGAQPLLWESPKTTAIVAQSAAVMQPHKCDCTDVQRLRSSSAKKHARLAFLALRAVANFAIVAIMPLA